MARKRDHKAEYAAAKRRAKAAGYKSQREYKTVRKTLSLPPRAMPVPKPIYETSYPWKRAESKRWSKEHSRRYTSKYRDSLTDEQVEMYWRAYVEEFDESGKVGATAKRKRIHDYLVPDIISEREWRGDYPV